MTIIDVKNIEGWMGEGRIHLLGSGHMLAPLKENDWFRTNFAVAPVAGIHLGFLVAAIRVTFAIEDKLKEMVAEMPEGQPLVISGYSLGGAVAEVLGSILRFASFLEGRRIQVHNLGGPSPYRRFSVVARLAAIRVETTWYSAGTDIVPFLLFWNGHVGNHRHIKTGWPNPFKNHLAGYTKVSMELSGG